MTETREPVRIAIVGGGIAGLYAAWRLSTAEGVELTLFEKDKRLGGRIFSAEVPGLPVRCELGAMRFPPRHKLLRSLLTRLGIPFLPFEVGNASLYVRGRHLSLQELGAGRCRRCGARSPFHLRSDEVGRSPTDLILGAIQTFLKEIHFDPDLSKSEARRIRKQVAEARYDEINWLTLRHHGRHDNVRLWDIGFWNLLQHYLSNEAYKLAHHALSLESVLGNWSVAVAIPWFLADFGTDERFMVPEGLEKLVAELEAEIEGRRAGAGFKRWHAKRNRAVFKLRLQQPGPEFVVSHKQTERKERRGEASGMVEERKPKAKEAAEESKDDRFDYVILALPQRALSELLEASSDGTSGVDRSAISDKRPDNEPTPGASLRAQHPKWLSSVRSHRLFKLFLVYESAWWRGHEAVPGEVGRIFTDLPLRQLYHFGPDWIDKVAQCIPPASGESQKTKKGAVRNLGQEQQEARAMLQDVARGKWALLMASYSDEHYAEFWEPPEHSRGPAIEPPRDCRTVERQVLLETLLDHSSPLRERLAGHRMLNKVQQQLQEVYDIEVPKPLFGVYMDWDQDKGRAGWHTWEVGRKPWECDDAIEEPWHRRLFVCGEAYSPEQGWIEGALKSVEWMLHRLRQERTDIEVERPARHAYHVWGGNGEQKPRDAASGEEKGAASEPWDYIRPYSQEEWDSRDKDRERDSRSEGKLPDGA